MSVSGIGDGRSFIFNVGTRTRRRGLKLAGTARSSRATSLTSTAKAVQWDAATYPNEMPLQVRYKTANAHRIFSEIGAEGSTATSRLFSGAGSTVYTDTASAVWSAWENVGTNFGAKSEDGVHSNVLGYVAGTGLWQYEVQTVPKY